MKKEQGPGPIRARDTDVNYFSVSGLLFLLGLLMVIFLVVFCFRAKRPGSRELVLLLDACEAVVLGYLLLTYRRHKKILARHLGFTRAAVERLGNGGARLEFPVGAKRYVLEVPKEEKLEQSGMVNVWYDPVDPANVFLGLKAPEKASPFALANFGLLLTLSVIVNVIFFIIR